MVRLPRKLGSDEWTARWNIENWTGLSGVELNHIISMLEKKGIDWQQVPDWKTIGEDIGDRSNPYIQVWLKLAEMYGIEKPETSQELKIVEQRWDDEEAEELMRTKEGVRELLRRIYKDPFVPKTKKEHYKDLLLEEHPAGLAVALALYDGAEKEYARRFIGEEVLPMTSKELREIMSGKRYARILTSEGKI